VNCCLPVHLPYRLAGRWGPWAIQKGTGQRTRRIVLAAGISKLVDALTWLTPSPWLTALNRSLSTTQSVTFTDAVTMPFFLQDPFNFNVEISVSSSACRYQDPAGFRPRVHKECSGSPAGIHAIQLGVTSSTARRLTYRSIAKLLLSTPVGELSWKIFRYWHHCLPV
jgi:hypothetical protein